MKIGVKFLLIILSITTLLGITALSAVFLSTGLLERETNGKYMAVSAYTMEKVHRLFSRRFEDLRLLANDPVIRSGNSSPRQITDLLLAYQKRYRAYAPYSSISFFDLTRTRIADTAGEKIGTRLPLAGFWEKIARGADEVLDISVAQPPAQEVFDLVHVVRSERGEPFGVLVARMPVETLDVLLERPLKLFKLGRIPDLELVDRHGGIIYSTHKGAGTLQQRLPTFPVVEQALAAGEDTGTLLCKAASRTGEDDILIFSREERDANFRGNQWILTISVPRRLALAPMIELRNRLILIIALIGFFSAGIAILLSRTITRPIVRLSEAAAEVGRGRLDITVKVTSRDEVGRLAMAFNGMVRRLGVLNHALRQAATVDGLTGSLNRNRLDQVMGSEMERARRYNHPLSLILFDLDHFKQINDTHGHQVGDEVLKGVIDVIRDNIRTTDLLGRWGGEEFLLLAPETDRERAVQLAEKIRQSVEGCHLDKVGRITISCGVAQMGKTDSEDGFLKRADDALYAAKRKGRNLVEPGLVA